MSTVKATRKKSTVPKMGFHWLRMMRVVIALLVLLLFVAVFADYRKGIEGFVVSWAAKTQFVPSWQSLLAGAGWGALGLFAVFIIGTLIFGRVYCSFLCPFGILQDVVAWVARKFKRGKNKTYKYAKPVKWVRPAIIGVMVLCTLLGAGSIFWFWLDPYSQFGRFISMFVKPAVIEGNNMLVDSVDKPVSWLYSVRPDWPWQFGWALLPVIALLLCAFVFAAWRGRLYCNTICPVGAILGFLSRFSLFRVGIDKSACTKCAMCMRSCKSQCIDLKTSEIDYSRCVNCFDCVSVCDGKGIKYRWAWGGGKQNGSSTGSKTVKPKESKTSSPDAPASVTDMMPSLGRRAFLGATIAGVSTSIMSCAEKKTGGAVKKEINPRGITPPGSRGVEEFLSNCTGCQLCVVACPGDCLKPSYMEYGVTGMFKPRMTYEHGFCQYECTTCTNVCPVGAILPLDKEEKAVVRIGKADLDLTHCIAANDKTDCGACAEHCPRGALEMVPFTQPQLVPQDCVSCLKCKEVCPSGAITYTQGRRKKPIFDYEKCIGCGKCVPGCEGSALHMKPSQWNIRVPVLDVRYCIGCGGCEYVCPPRTIVVKAIPIHETADTLVEEKVVNPNEGVDFPF